MRSSKKPKIFVSTVPNSSTPSTLSTCGGENPDGICNFGYEGPRCAEDVLITRRPNTLKVCLKLVWSVRECQEGVSGTGVVIIFFIIAVTVIVVTVRETMRRASERKERK